MLRAVRVRKGTVNLPQLERGRVPTVLHAKHEGGGSLASSHDRSCRRRFSLSSLRPIPCASYQCSSARQTVPSRSLTVAVPFRFRHRPEPYLRLKRLRSRTARPAAIVSMSTISPRRSKYTLAVVSPRHRASPANDRRLSSRAFPDAVSVMQHQPGGCQVRRKIK